MLTGLAYGQPTSILVSCIPVYSAIVLGVITKSGVENVYKGKTEAASVVIGKADKAAGMASAVNVPIENG